MKLGRVKSLPDRRTVQLSAVVAASGILPGVPSVRRWSRRRSSTRDGIPFGEFLNTKIGCCTAASIAHFDQLVGEHTHTTPIVDDAIVERAYREVGGYDPADPDTDNGAPMLGMLKWFRKLEAIESFAELDYLNMTHVELAIDLFGGCYVGLDLPRAWQTAEIWDVAPAGRRDSAYGRNTWGGHAVWICDYDQSGFWLPTWGRMQRLTRAGLIGYGDECYLATSKRWKSPAGSPSGYLAAVLDAAAARL